MEKKSAFIVISQILLLCTVLFAIAIPWVNVEYSPDILIIARYIVTDLPNDFASAFVENTVYVYAFSELLSGLEPRTQVIIAQNLGVLLITRMLTISLKPPYALCIVLLTFFTIFLNQFRLATAMAFGIYVMRIHPSENLKRICCLAIASLLHLFIGAWFIILLTVEYISTLALKRRIAVLTVLILGLGLVFSQINIDPEIRYYAYLEEEGVASQSFLLTMVILIASWKGLNKVHRTMAVALTIVCFGTFALPSISGRVSELTCIMILLWSNLSGRSSGAGSIISVPRLSDWRVASIVFACGAFFVYRFVRIIVLQMFAIPDDLLYY